MINLNDFGMGPSMQEDPLEQEMVFKNTFECLVCGKEFEIKYIKNEPTIRVGFTDVPLKCTQICPHCGFANF